MSFQITTFAHGGNSGAATSSSTGAFNASAGNLIVVAVSVFNPNGVGLPPNISDTALNNYTLIGSSPVSPSGVNGLTNIWFYYSNNITGNIANVVKNTWTASTNESFSQIVAWQISAAASGNPVNTFQIGGAASASNAQSTAPLTTTLANSIILAYGSLTNTGATYTAGSGYTLDMGTADDGGLSGAEHQQFSSIQTGIVPAITASDSTHKWQMMAVAIAGASQPSSGAYSVPDCRVAPFGPNSSRTVQGTVTYDVQTSSNHSMPPTDSRVTKPTDCRVSPNIPQNSRTPGTFGPGE